MPAYILSPFIHLILGMANKRKNRSQENIPANHPRGGAYKKMPIPS
jgi:hypothetical protein